MAGNPTSDSTSATVPDLDSEPTVETEVDYTTLTEAAVSALSSMQNTEAPVSSTTASSSNSSNPSSQLDQNAIIAGVIIGLMLIALSLAGVCLARARQRRATGGGGGGSGRGSSSNSKTTQPVREPNPYTNPCFDATKEEMGERPNQTEEPGKTAAESVNSVRNKEDHWIIPMEELTEDDAASNYDTTRF